MHFDAYTHVHILTPRRLRKLLYMHILCGFLVLYIYLVLGHTCTHSIALVSHILNSNCLSLSIS